VEIPESLRSYFDNEAVRRAVDELVEEPDMPECYWKEAQNYNQALLMAAQVRADYAALLCDIWEATFGTSDPQRLLGEYFSYEELSPKQIWESGWLWRNYYRDGDPDEGGRCDELCVFMDGDKLELRVYRTDDNSDYYDSETTDPQLSSTCSTFMDAEGAVPYVANKSVTRAKFFTDPDSVIDRFAKDASNIIQALLQT